MNLKIISFRIIAILVFFQTATFGWEEKPEIAKLFNDAQINGTFVLYDVSNNKFIGYNESRAKTRYIPASTFKIANSLIGLAEGAVKNVDEILPYKGETKPFIAAWGHDMGLREAIKLSNVPIYQELARRIGLNDMRLWLKKLDYGNQEVGNVVDRFWLDGPLKITALEQSKFLAKLTQNTLPLPKQIQKSVKEIVLIEKRKNLELYGKTGWQNAPNKGVGWWVGWIKKDGHTYTFALNIDINKPSDANKRVMLGKASLKLLGLL